eukprot:2806895-Rhodomonas_salina.1
MDRMRCKDGVYVASADLGRGRENLRVAPAQDAPLLVRHGLVCFRLTHPLHDLQRLHRKRRLRQIPLKRLLRELSQILALGFLVFCKHKIHNHQQAWSVGGRERERERERRRERKRQHACAQVARKALWLTMCFEYADRVGAFVDKP